MTRLSPAREAEIRAKPDIDPDAAEELLVELDAVRRERDEVQHRSDERLKDYQAKAKTLQDAIANLRDERDEAVKVAATMRDALAAYRSALRCGEPESDRLRALGDAALAAVPSSTDRPSTSGGQRATLGPREDRDGLQHERTQT